MDLTGCYRTDNFFKFKTENKFNHRHTFSIPRITRLYKIGIFPTLKLRKLAFCNSLLGSLTICSYNLSAESLENIFNSFIGLFFNMLVFIGFGFFYLSCKHFNINRFLKIIRCACFHGFNSFLNSGIACE